MHIQTLTLLYLLVMLFTLSLEKSSYEYETALCVSTPTKQCPQIKQRKGVCCKKSPSLEYKFYLNSCIACKDGCQEFLFKRDLDENCNKINQNEDL